MADDLRVLVWNIENFTNGPRPNQYGPYKNEIRQTIVAKTIRSQDIDLCLIMETGPDVKEFALGILNKLEPSAAKLDIDENNEINAANFHAIYSNYTGKGKDGKYIYKKTEKKWVTIPYTTGITKITNRKKGKKPTTSYYACESYCAIYKNDHVRLISANIMNYDDDKNVRGGWQINIINLYNGRRQCYFLLHAPSPSHSFRIRDDVIDFFASKIKLIRGYNDVIFCGDLNYKKNQFERHLQEKMNRNNFYNILSPNVEDIPSTTLKSFGSFLDPARHLIFSETYDQAWRFKKKGNLLYKILSPDIIILGAREQNRADLSIKYIKKTVKKKIKKALSEIGKQLGKGKMRKVSIWDSHDYFNLVNAQLSSLIGPFPKISGQKVNLLLTTIITNEDSEIRKFLSNRGDRVNRTWIKYITENIEIIIRNLLLLEKFTLRVRNIKYYYTYHSYVSDHLPILIYKPKKRKASGTDDLAPPSPKRPKIIGEPAGEEEEPAVVIEVEEEPS